MKLKKKKKKEMKGEQLSGQAVTITELKPYDGVV